MGGNGGEEGKQETERWRKGGNKRWDKVGDIRAKVTGMAMFYSISRSVVVSSRGHMKIVLLG